ncbi:MAG: AraC family transcriptional regulator [Verrucomicrobiae bacterium]|nr:AraC family transcriptional regulator [Verrucomicrobiae bacterium]
MTDSEQPHLGKKAETKAALRAAVFRAARTLEDHIDEPPNTAALAASAGVSKSHFQRAFRDVVGETVQKHTLRLRVERAASLLKYSNWQVADIALACGFSTQASFNRSFKQLYCQSPLEFRKAKATVPFLRGHFRSRPNATLESNKQPLPTVTIENWSEIEAVCLRYYGSVNECYRPWIELISWARHHVSSYRESRFFGLWFDDFSDLGVEANYRYECLIVPQQLPEEVPDPFFVRKISAGEVAVARASGRLRDLEAAWEAFGTGWLPFSGFQPRGDYVIDEYPTDLVTASLPRKALATALGTIQMRMCIPVQRTPLAM